MCGGIWVDTSIQSSVAVGRDCSKGCHDKLNLAFLGHVMYDLAGFTSNSAWRCFQQQPGPYVELLRDEHPICECLLVSYPGGRKPWSFSLLGASLGSVCCFITCPLLSNA